MFKKLYLLCFVFSIQYGQAASFTYIDFYVSNDIPKNLVESKITNSIADSNLVLSNSSLPLTRKQGHIYFSSSLADVNYDRLDLVMIQLMIEDYNLYKKLIDGSRLSVLLMKSPTSTKSLCGSTVSISFPNIAIIDLNCDSLTLEHELGHLYGAQHETVYEEDLIPYAYAAVCGRYITIMSSVTSSVKNKQIIKAYSFPELKVYGDQCGSHSTNNRKVMLDNIEKFQFY